MSTNLEKLVLDSKLEEYNEQNIIMDQYIDEHGEINQEKLIEYLDEEFIPKNVNSMFSYDKYSEKKGQSIPLFKVLSMCLTDEEFEIVMDHLNSKGIIVRGTDYLAEALDFENYQYLRNYHHINLKEPLTHEEQIKYFRQYKATQDKESLNVLFEHNMRLAKFLAFKFSYLLEENYDDADILAQEGLLIAIRNYDPDKGYNFSTYAYPCIEGYFLRNRFSYAATGNENLLVDVNKYRREIEKQYGEKLSDRGENYDQMVEAIANLSLQNGICIPDPSNKEEIRNRIYKKDIKSLLNIIYPDYYDDDTVTTEHDVYKQYTDNAYKDVYNRFLRDDLIDIIDNLDTISEIERNVLYERFGINDECGCHQLLEKVGDKFGITRGRALQIECKTLRKLRRKETRDKLSCHLCD